MKHKCPLCDLWFPQRHDDKIPRYKILSLEEHLLHFHHIHTDFNGDWRQKVIDAHAMNLLKEMGT